MKTSFLEYYKIILDKVRFDRSLLMKEYRKAIKLLRDKEIDDLNRWLTSQGIYPVLQNRKDHFIPASRGTEGDLHEVGQPVI
jgi:hypothetical protein